MLVRGCRKVGCGLVGGWGEEWRRRRLQRDVKLDVHLLRWLGRDTQLSPNLRGEGATP
jgi:hypothetical protein